jgi:hypothetical protein
VEVIDDQMVLFSILIYCYVVNVLTPSSNKFWKIR